MDSRPPQPMFKWAWVFIFACLFGIVPTEWILPVAILIVGIDLVLPWKWWKPDVIKN